MSLVQQIRDVLKAKPSAKPEKIAEILGESVARVNSGLAELKVFGEAQEAETPEEG